MPALRQAATEPVEVQEPPSDASYADAYFTLANVYYALRQSEKALVAPKRKGLDFKPDLAAEQL
jgi:hypothetical protein